MELQSSRAQNAKDHLGGNSEFKYDPTLQTQKDTLLHSVWT